MHLGPGSVAVTAAVPGEPRDRPPPTPASPQPQFPPLCTQRLQRSERREPPASKPREAWAPVTGAGQRQEQRAEVTRGRRGANYNSQDAARAAILASGRWLLLLSGSGALKTLESPHSRFHAGCARGQPGGYRPPVPDSVPLWGLGGHVSGQRSLPSRAQGVQWPRTKIGAEWGPRRGVRAPRGFHSNSASMPGLRKDRRSPRGFARGGLGG